MKKNLQDHRLLCPSKNCKGMAHVHSKKHKRYRCSICGRTWVAHFNRATYRIKKSLDQIKMTKKLYDEGHSIRSIAHFVKISPSTVVAWAEKFDF